MPKDVEAKSEGTKLIAQNRSARREFEVLDTYEAGIVLVGSEVKSLRQGKVNLKGSFAAVDRGQVMLHGAHIQHYESASHFNHQTERPRKLLLHRAEIRRLIGRTQEQGLTLVPLKFYFKRGKVKVELAVARGKKLHDKRRDIARRDVERDLQRALRERAR